MNRAVKKRRNRWRRRGLRGAVLLVMCKLERRVQAKVRRSLCSMTVIPYTVVGLEQMQVRYATE